MISAAAGFAYLVTDRIYETNATIVSQLSNPNDPFGDPFTIINNSHIFWLRNTSWECRNAEIIDEGNNIVSGMIVKPISGFQNALAPGATLNFYCNMFGPTSRAFQTPQKIKTAQFDIAFKYDADLWLWNWTRTPAPTQFTWSPGSTHPQWIRGIFAR